MLASCHRQEFSVRLDTENFCCAIGIERQVQSGAYANLQDTPRGCRYDSLSIWDKLTIPHRQIHKMRHDVFLVDCHSSLFERPLPRLTGPFLRYAI